MRQVFNPIFTDYRISTALLMPAACSSATESMKRMDVPVRNEAASPYQIGRLPPPLTPTLVLKDFKSDGSQTARSALFLHSRIRNRLRALRHSRAGSTPSRCPTSGRVYAVREATRKLTILEH